MKVKNLMKNTIQNNFLKNTNIKVLSLGDGYKNWKKS